MILNLEPDQVKNSSNSFKVQIVNNVQSKLNFEIILC